MKRERRQRGLEQGLAQEKAYTGQGDERQSIANPTTVVLPLKVECFQTVLLCDLEDDYAHKCGKTHGEGRRSVVHG